MGVARFWRASIKMGSQSVERTSIFVGLPCWTCASCSGRVSGALKYQYTPLKGIFMMVGRGPPSNKLLAGDGAEIFLVFFCAGQRMTPEYEVFGTST